MTFAIGPFRDTVMFGVSPLDCVVLLLGLPYQQARHVVYHAKTHQYHLQQEGHTYVLTCIAPKSTQPVTKHASIKNVSLNKDVSLCLVHPTKPDNLTNPTSPYMAPLLHEFVDIFIQPMGLPPHRSIAHMINLLPATSLPNAPTYHLAPRDPAEIECQIHQLLESCHIQPSLSPCAPPASIIPKKENFEWHLVTDSCALNNTTIQNRYCLPLIEDLLDHLQGACFFTKMDLTSGYHQVHMHDIWTHFSLPTSIISNKDSRFLSTFWHTLWCLLGFQHRFSTAFHPQTGGQTEVVNRTLVHSLRSYFATNK